MSEPLSDAARIEQEVSLRRRVLNVRTIGSLIFGVVLLYLVSRVLFGPSFDWGEVGRLIGVYSRPHAGIITIAYEATVVGGRPEPAAEASEVRAFGPDEIPWDEIAFSTAESALRDWVASLPGRGPRFEPELYVEGDPAEPE